MNKSRLPQFSPEDIAAIQARVDAGEKPQLDWAEWGVFGNVKASVTINGDYNMKLDYSSVRGDEERGFARQALAGRYRPGTVTARPIVPASPLETENRAHSPRVWK